MPAVRDVDLARRLDALSRGPFDARAAAEAKAALEDLAARPRAHAPDVILLARHAALFAALGLDADALAVARAWLARGVAHPALARAAATHALVASPSAMELRLRDVSSPGEADALRTVQAFMRGDLPQAVALARRHTFFVAHADLPFVWATAYGAWALALLGESEEAGLVLASWRERHRDAPSRAVQFVLRAFAWIAGLAGDHAAAEDLVGQAMALCEEDALAVERAFVEVELAFASLRAGDDAAARAIVLGWYDLTPPAAVARSGLLEAYRDLARAELALEDRDPASARAAAERALAYFDRCGNTLLACDARLALCLAEVEARTPAARTALAGYRRAAQRVAVPHHVRTVRFVEALVRSTARARLVLHTAEGEDDAPAVRVVRPEREALSADLYLDAVRRAVWIRGAGPFALGEHPVVERVLEVLAAAGGEGLPLDELFTAVWGGTFHPLRHENKVHVTLHRLRQWLEARREGGAALVRLTRGVVGLDEAADVRVLTTREVDDAKAARRKPDGGSGLRGARRLAYAARS